MTGDFESDVHAPWIVRDTFDSEGLADLLLLLFEEHRVAVAEASLAW